jgi:hypothetical protein
MHLASRADVDAGRYALEPERLDYQEGRHASEGCRGRRRHNITVDTPIRSSYTSRTCLNKRLASAVTDQEDAHEPFATLSLHLSAT